MTREQAIERVTAALARRRDGTYSNEWLARHLVDLIGDTCADGTHSYLSTACHHDMHVFCRHHCKYCPATCRCTCHDEATDV